MNQEVQHMSVDMYWIKQVTKSDWIYTILQISQHISLVKKTSYKV
jgi:hypothetical protein